MEVEHHKESTTDVRWLDLIPDSQSEAFNLGIIYAAAAKEGGVVRRLQDGGVRISLTKCLPGAEIKP